MSWMSGVPPYGELDEETARRLVQAAHKETISQRTPQERLLLELSHRYPFRIRRILKDMRWLEKKARKRGISFQ